MKTSRSFQWLFSVLTFVVAVGTCFAESPSVQSLVCE